MAQGSRELALAKRQLKRRLQAVTGEAVARLWSALGSYDEQDVDRLLAGVLPIVEAAQRQSVRVTDVYVARALGREPLGVNPERAIGARARNGTAPEEVYRRPFVTHWAALSQGVPYEQALRRGLDRLVSTAETDIQLATRQATREIGLEEPRIYGWQRIPGDACDLCLIASTQRYRTGDLFPIHNKCGCEVAPLYEPTGRVINPELLDELKSEGAIDRITAQRAQARDIELADPPEAVAVQHHGELGPVLTDADHHFEEL